MWAVLSLVYGLLKGVREICKKEAMAKSPKMEVLFFYTLLSFCFMLPFTMACLPISPVLLVPVFCKSAVLFAAWICSFSALEKMPVSSYGVLDLSRVLFSTLLSVMVLGEDLKRNGIIGLILVCLGLFLLGFQPRHKTGVRETTPAKYIIMATIACLLNSLSAIIDKLALSTELKSIQMLYWYLAFMVPMYLVWLLVRRARLHWRALICNPWIYVLSAVFVFAEYCLFCANAIPDSRVSVMTLMKQSACLVTIFGGKLVFGEKQILKKTICALIVIAGIVLSVTP